MEGANRSPRRSSPNPHVAVLAAAGDHSLTIRGEPDNQADSSMGGDLEPFPIAGTSQSLTVPSSLVVARFLPSGEWLTQFTSDS